MFEVISGILMILVIILSIFTRQIGKGVLWFVSGVIAIAEIGDSGLFLVSLIFFIILVKGLTKCEYCGERIGAFGKKFEKQGHVFCKDCIQTIDFYNEEEVI